MIFWFCSHTIVHGAVQKVPKQIEEFYQRIEKTSIVQEEKKKKQQEILDKAKEHYGYDLDYRDER